MRDKYGVTQDKYCYPKTQVLTNLLGIHNAKKLAEAEVAFSAARYLSYSSHLSSIEQFDFSHLKYLHFHLFQDVYTWAGKIRDVDIAKGSTRFCTFTRIEPEAKKLFDRIPLLAEQNNWQAFLEMVADLFCEINLLHPFREGNGRVQRFFFEEMLFILGYDVNWPPIHQQQWIDANIAGVHLDLAPLKSILEQAISVR